MARQARERQLPTIGRIIASAFSNARQARPERRAGPSPSFALSASCRPREYTIGGCLFFGELAASFRECFLAAYLFDQPKFKKAQLGPRKAARVVLEMEIIGRNGLT